MRPSTSAARGSRGRRARVALAAPIAIGLASACTSGESARAGVRWEATTLWTGQGSFERLRVGRADVGHAIVGVDQRGDVTLVRLHGDDARGQVVHAHGAELTGLAFGDVDPRVAGDEIYAGGDARDGGGGVVLQLAREGDGWRARTVVDAGSYVHTIEVLEPEDGASAGELRRLVIGTYAGEVRLLSPNGPPNSGGTWTEEVVWRDAPGGEPQTHQIKDIALLRGGAARRAALVVFRGGRALHLDLEHPADARVVHEEPGGLSRCLADGDGGAYAIGYTGRVLHLKRARAGFDVEVVCDEGAESGLRGIVAGRFPLSGGEATLAVFGYHALVRALVPPASTWSSGGAWEASTLFRDDAKGHALAAAELVPGNDADELLIAGQGKRIVLLVARRER